jgi:hypothetical protein
MLTREDVHEALWTWIGAMVFGTLILMLINL